LTQREKKDLSGGISLFWSLFKDLHVGARPQPMDGLQEHPWVAEDDRPAELIRSLLGKGLDNDFWADARGVTQGDTNLGEVMPDGKIGRWGDRVMRHENYLFNSESPACRRQGMRLPAGRQGVRNYKFGI
jgi:hypothetical protein